MKKIIFPCLFICCFMHQSFAQQTISLYEGNIPNSKPYHTKEWWEPQDNGDTIVHYMSQPTLTIFLPGKEKANGTAVVICPGGGYWVNSIVKEGYAVAKKMNEWGVAAFVLKYRIPNDSSMIDKKIGPLQDAQRALQLVRMHAKEWNVDANKVGIMGFSAGGHLASTAATHFQQNYIDNDKGVNLRPDFAILIYPVISFLPGICHVGSKEQLVGKNAGIELVNEYSNELQVTEQTPPTFLVHASDDDAVISMNSIAFYDSLVSKKIPAEIHIYQSGGHGFGTFIKNSQERWMDRCESWLKFNGWLQSKQ